MKSRSALAMFAALTLLLAACGGDDDGSDAGDPSAADGTANDDGEGNAAGDSGQGAGVDLGDFPIPLPAGAEAVLETDAGGGITVVQFTLPLDKVEGAVAFYDDWTSNEPDDYQRSEAESGGLSWVNASGGDDSVVIAILSRLGDDDFQAVTLTVGPLG